MAQIRTFPLRPVRRPDPEPSLAELLDDPLTQTVMRRDGVTRPALERLLDAARRALAGTGPDRCCA